MTAKKKLEDIKNRAFQLLDEHPLETITVAAAFIAASAKLVSSVSEARRTSTWEREVRRRERLQK